MDAKTKRVNLWSWHVTTCQICNKQLAFRPEFGYSQNKYSLKKSILIKFIVSRLGALLYA
jgi:hypothetical protein